MFYAYLFDIFIDDIASTETFQQNKNFMYYILRVIHETLNTQTIELTPVVILSFCSIYVEYPIYCNLNTILAATSTSPVIFQILDQRASPG